MLEERRLSPADQLAFSGFRCSQFPDPTTRVVQEMVEHHLADSLRSDSIDGIGLWEGGQLVALIAWSVVGEQWRSAILAVDPEHQHRGLASRLKRRLLELAADGGAAVVVSRVHWDNEPMLAINRSLGGSIRRIEGDPDRALCIVPTRSV